MDFVQFGKLFGNRWSVTKCQKISVATKNISVKSSMSEYATMVVKYQAEKILFGKNSSILAQAVSNYTCN